MPGDVAGPMLGDMSRIDRMKGFDPSGKEAFRLRPERGGRPSAFCPLALRETTGDAKESSASECAIASGLGEARLGDEVPGTVNSDRGDGDGPSAILCKGAGSAYRPSLNSGCIRDAICEYQGCRFNFSTSVVSKRPRTSLIDRPSE